MNVEKFIAICNQFQRITRNGKFQKVLKIKPDWLKISKTSNFRTQDDGSTDSGTF